TNHSGARHQRSKDRIRSFRSFSCDVRGEDTSCAASWRLLRNTRRLFHEAPVRTSEFAPRNALADPGTPERERRRWAAVTPRELRLVGDAAMRDAIREPGVRRLSAEIEIGLTRMADGPFADAVVQFEQAGLVGDLGTRLSRNEPARRGRRDRRLLIARSLANEPAWTDRTILEIVGARA